MRWRSAPRVRAWDYPEATTGIRASRAGISSLAPSRLDWPMVEGVEQLLRQGRVEVLRDPDSTSQETRSATWALPLQRPEPRYRLASPGDDDLRAASCLVDQ